MRKTWIFLKLRVLQLKSDKTALFFCYVLPVLLLVGVGYPLQNRDKPVIAVTYTDTAASPASKALIGQLQAGGMVQLEAHADAEGPAQQAVIDNQQRHHLVLRALPGEPARIGAELYGNSLAENRIENTALQAVVDAALREAGAPPATAHVLTTTRYTSYVVTLLPGLIGMTLLVIGLGGFGGVLIEERDHGLFKNLKTIDASPVPFLVGLFLSRLLVCYSVAAALVGIGVWVFGIPTDINLPLLLGVVTLGCVAFLGIGMVLATVSPSVTAFNGIVNFVQMPLVLLGGVFFSVAAFPDWLRPVTQALPLTQLNDAMRALLFEGVGFADLGSLAMPLGVLSLWCLATLVFARLRFKW
jgi:ABC-type multidrug transport system permease subunit